MKEWESGLIVIIVMVTLFFVFLVLTNKTREEAQHARSQQLPIEFGLASWLVNFYRIGLVLSILGAAAILVLMKDGPGRYVALFIPAVSAFLTGVGLFVDTKKKVIITDDMVTYRSVFNSFEIPLGRIQRVWSEGGFIIIDTGEKTRKVIPMMFQGNGQILITLQSKAKHMHLINEINAPR